jgi:HEAT repeat protein
LAARADRGELGEDGLRMARLAGREAVLSDDPTLRSWGLVLLSLTRDDTAASSALRATSDAEPGVRTAAVLVLGKEDSPDRIRALCRLLDDPDSPVRQMVAGAMMDVGDVEFLPALRAVVERETNDQARDAQLAAIAALERSPG